MNTGLAVSFCAQALVKIGERPITAFDDATDASALAKLRYEPVLRHLLSLHPWRFAATIQQLSKLTEQPGGDWYYAYRLPTNPPFLLLVRLLHQDGSDVGSVGYEIYGEELYTDIDGVKVEYIARVEEDRFPPYFVEALVWALAADFAPALTDDSQRQRTALEMRELSLARAKNLDSGQTPNPAVVDDAGLVSGRF